MKRNEFYGSVCTSGIPADVFGVTDTLSPVIAHLVEASKPLPPAYPMPSARGSILRPIEDARDSGGEIPRLVFSSAANPTYQRHADALHKLFAEANLDALCTYPIKGRNTYARALRRYRDVLLGVAPTNPEKSEKSA